MNRVNRKKGPRIYSEYNIEVPEFKRTQLDNDMPLLEIRAGSQEIVRVDIVFKSGRIHETRRASAKASFYLLREGSTQHDSDELAEIYDYYGAYVKTFSGLEYSSVSLVVMARYFDKVWPVFRHMVFNPAYPEHEVRKYARIYSQKLTDQLAKNDVISYRALTEEIFGADHPYGYNTMPENLLDLKREDIVRYHENHHVTENAFALLSGKYGPEIKETVTRDISAFRKSGKSVHPPFYEKPLEEKLLKFPSDHRAQTSLKVGRRLFARRHPDYSKFQFLNTLLGGYFGSRLMKNIREDKGFTYGIYSSIDTWTHDGLFYISADIANDAVDQTLEEIYKEINLLKTRPVPDEEFLMVKNYKLGQILHLIDGPFATGQLIKNIYAKNLDIEHFKKHIERVKAMQKEDIMEMADKYLQKNTFITVLAGNF